MKNSFALLLVVSAGLTFLSSCRKEDQGSKMLTTEVMVTLEKNQPYVYTLPENTSEEGFMISKQASHFEKSELSTSLNQFYYSYTPARDYTGNDEVIITLAGEEHHDKKGHHFAGGGGGCHQDDETGQTIIIHFNIVDPGTNTVMNAEYQ